MPRKAIYPVTATGSKRKEAKSGRAPILQPIAAPADRLRVWWIPQVPGARFFVPVATLDEARLVLETLGRYDAFQYEHRIKPDYANVGGLEMFEDGEWFEWCSEDGDEISDIMRVERAKQEAR